MLVFVVAFLIIFALNSALPVQPFFGIENKEIFLLAGQSNMAGRGGVEGQLWDKVVPLECSPNPRIVRLTKNLTWEEAQEPLHFDMETNKTSGVGPGMAFAKALLRKDPFVSVIGLVPCAFGGTKISQWQGGEFLYNRLVERANAALLDGGCIRAMLWYQGESDCNDAASASMYGARLKQFFSDLRADLGDPLLPIVQVALASTAGRYVDVVRKAQLELDLPNVVCLDAYELEVKKDDTLHLSTAAQVELGRIFADAVLSFGF